MKKIASVIAFALTLIAAAAFGQVQTKPFAGYIVDFHPKHVLDGLSGCEEITAFTLPLILVYVDVGGGIHEVSVRQDMIPPDQYCQVALEIESGGVLQVSLGELYPIGDLGLTSILLARLVSAEPRPSLKFSKESLFVPDGITDLTDSGRSR